MMSSETPSRTATDHGHADGLVPTVFVRYLLPLIWVAAAFVPTFFLAPLRERSTFLLFIVAVAASAAFGGLRSGMLATALSLMVAFPLLRSTDRQAGGVVGDLLPMATFVLLSIAIGLVAQRTRRGLMVAGRRAQALRRSEESYRRVVELADEGIWSVDPRASTTYVNRRLARMLGFSSDQMLGHSVFGFVAPADREAARRMWERVRGGETVHGELSLRRKDGETLWVRMAGTPMYDGQEFAGAVAMLTDVSAQKHDRETLAQSESLLRSVIDGTDDAVFVKDREGRYLLINPAGARAFGRPAGEIVGKTDRELLPEAVAERIVERDRHILAHEEPLTFAYTLEDGEPRHFSAMAAPHRDGHGRVIGVLAIARDVTAQRRVDEERIALLAEAERARQEAEAANRAKDEFLATLSHELRTPLTSIVGWAKMLRSGQLDAETSARAIETIDRNARLQTQLIADVLDLSRIVSGKLRLNLRPIDLVPVVEAALDTVRPAAEAKGITIRPLVDSHPCTVSGDPDRLQQVVWNLLSNAIKFTPRGGAVDVRLLCQGSEAEILVADTGIGISLELLPHVFERFRQGDASSTRSYGGLGLGLAIVRHLVELHGGRVEAESAGLGQGARFRVRVPLFIDAEGTESPRDGERRRTEAEPPPPPPTLTGLKVLVVDDEPDARELVRTILGHAGADVRVADSAATALKMLEAERHDVLLSDLEMPEQSGYALIRRVRQLPRERGGRIPAAALTAYARLEDRTRALRAGFQIHISKPLNPTELATIVASLAGRLQEV